MTLGLLLVGTGSSWFRRKSYKLNGYESRTVYLSQDGSRSIFYIRKASPGIVPRDLSDYQVLARRRIFLEMSSVC